MPRYIDADKVNAALDRIREEVWLHDIPSPTVPEYIEHHETMQRLMIVIDKERKLLNDAAADVVPVRHGRWVIYKAPDAYHCGLIKCPFCGEDMIAESDEYNFCPNCGAKMDGGDGE